MKNYTKKSIKASNGITLIALVITIIVLLILAGISISMLSGDNSILQKATDAKTKTNEVQIKEKIRLAYNSALVKDATNQNGKVQKSTFEDELKVEFPEKTISIEDSADKKEWVVTIDETVENVPIGNETSNGPKLPNTEETTPWLPTGATVIENDLDKGVTVKDGRNNEWTWVVVPKNITKDIATIGDLEDPTGTDLENTLKDYASTVVTNRGQYKDTWEGNTQAGMTKEQYNTKKREMLNSIKKNGGFWIGKYEVGSEDVRSPSNIGNTSTPLIQPDKYPYTYVTYNQAETLAETLTQGLGGNGSLMFGTQWDLVLKYLNTKASLDPNDSTIWGNHFNSSLTIDSEKAKGSTNSSGQTPTWSAVTEKANLNRMVLTTGASNATNKLNICDIAGNVLEWTLEYSGDSFTPNTLRGGSFNKYGTSVTYPASYREKGSIYSDGTDIYLGGFRATLY